MRSLVEYALTDAAKEIAVLKRELDAAKGLISFFAGFCLGVLVPSLVS